MKKKVLNTLKNRFKFVCIYETFRQDCTLYAVTFAVTRSLYIKTRQCSHIYIEVVVACWLLICITSSMQQHSPSTSVKKSGQIRLHSKQYTGIGQNNKNRADSIYCIKNIDPNFIMRVYIHCRNDYLST